MSEITKPKVALVTPIDPEEEATTEFESIQPKSDSHMSIKVSPPPAVDYFSADYRAQAGEEDELLSRDNFDLEFKKPKPTFLRSRRFCIAIAVVAVLLIAGAIFLAVYVETVVN
ncbi:hypothetical protein BGW37DRAFT_531558 [Umbelopsis sp. PMI_123]|nr:hypothetical protein BGW37DRAFT_531558 [Umbelopsis sp. PMI_123]